MKTYTANVTRSGSWWAVTVPELTNVFTQARRLDQIEAAVREVISLMIDVPESSFAVKVNVDLPETIDAHLQQAVRLRAEADKAQKASAAAARAAAQKLVAGGITVRDAGRILGVSHQRVNQLTGTGTKRTTKTAAKSVKSARVSRTPSVKASA